MTTNHSLGKMEVIESKDKTFNKHVIREGNGDKLINEGSIVKLYVSLVNTNDMDDQLFGNYKLNDWCEVTIGKASTTVADLLDNIVLTMKEKEKAYVKTKMNVLGKMTNSALSNDDMKISKPDEALIKFNIIIDTVHRVADLEELEADERIERSEEYKEDGSKFFKFENYQFAIKRYLSSVKCVESISEEMYAKMPKSFAKQSHTLLCSNYLNLALCYSKLNQIDINILKYCDMVLNLEPENIKALYRRGCFHSKSNEYDLAIKDLSTALKFDKSNKAALKELKLVCKRKDEEKKMYKKMFSN